MRAMNELFLLLPNMREDRSKSFSPYNLVDEIGNSRHSSYIASALIRPRPVCPADADEQHGEAKNDESEFRSCLFTLGPFWRKCWLRASFFVFLCQNDIPVVKNNIFLLRNPQSQRLPSHSSME